MARVVVGLSGGVDSSVAAHLLVEQGHDVIGLFMRNWVDDSVILDEDCPWIEDSNDALLVAEKLNIPFQVVDMSADYKTRIVDYMFAEYQSGRTPNPDVLCNREVKFDLFLQEALKLGASHVATGHYVQQTLSDDGVYHLNAGADLNKDQSYFLCQLNQDQLKHALFPIGDMQKSEVRALAKSLDLVTGDKKDSQGLCFIGKVRLPDFLQQQLEVKQGDIVEIAPDWQGFNVTAIGQKWSLSPEDGKVVGQHQGAHFFTIGQRKGLLVGGKAEPLFVIATDTTRNVIYVGQGESHPGLLRKGLRIDGKDIHWVEPDKALALGEERSILLRFRYRQPLFKATMLIDKQGMQITFNEPQKAVAAGQFAAWYDKNTLIGSGVIHG
ncbi:MAG: tRNA 2-thiouridine(34) synthase MnmA [Bacteroidetes bacterium]|nr:tRNA 2-thiouridine(34) synthase MnmA [Bacteroidota bacterium]